MSVGPVVVMIFCCALMACTVLVYERLLAKARFELEEAVADAALATDLFLAERDSARLRHPSTIPTNVRVLRAVD